MMPNHPRIPYRGTSACTTARSTDHHPAPHTLMSSKCTAPCAFNRRAQAFRHATDTQHRGADVHPLGIGKRGLRVRYVRLCDLLIALPLRDQDICREGKSVISMDVMLRIVSHMVGSFCTCVAVDTCRISLRQLGATACGFLLCLWIVETDTSEHRGVSATQDELRLPLRAHIRTQQRENLCSRHMRS